MEPAPLESRRATLEDLESLQGLWAAAGLPADELARFLGEFQVVTDPQGRLVHSIGLLVEGDQALLHSEASAQSPSEDPDVGRAAAWRRLRIVARNQGISRIWTREDADYWRTCGFHPVTVAELPRELPPFLQREDGWWVYQHPEPAQADQLVKREMALWKTQREQESETFQRKVRTFKAVALGLFALAMILLLAFLFTVMRLRPDAFRSLFR